MIITKLNGGLGNQLFEYACARNLQINNRDSLYLDIEGFKRSPRNFSLSNFILSEEVDVLPIKESSSLLFWLSFSKVNKKLAFNLGKLFNIFLWKSPVYLPLALRKTKNKKIYLYGYWQSIKYFKENEKIIQKELRVKTEIPATCSDLLSEINMSNSICVHIRRGDYVSCGLLLCNEEYYNRGINYIFDKHPDSNVLIFSDDIEWVKLNMKFEHPVTYVEEDLPDYETLRLMYFCKHFVISNSSFSWWASYLSENPNKIIVAPQYWLPKARANKEMYLDNWIVL